MTVLKEWRRVVKLTDANGYTYNRTQWGAGVTNPCGVLSGSGGLCGRGFYHAYHTAEIAAFLNPIGANFDADTVQFWDAEIRGVVEDEAGGLKLGATEMRTVRLLSPIRPTTEQRIVFALYIASVVGDQYGNPSPEWDRWRDSWMDGTDRSVASAERAASAASAASAERAAWAASAAWAESAAWAAWAESAAWAAWAARAASAARAERAAWAASAAWAESAERAAWAESAAWAAWAARAASAAWAAESAAWAESAANAARAARAASAERAERAAWAASAAWAESTENIILDAAVIALSDTWETSR